MPKSKKRDFARSGELEFDAPKVVIQLIAVLLFQAIADLVGVFTEFLLALRAALAASLRQARSRLAWLCYCYLRCRPIGAVFHGRWAVGGRGDRAARAAARHQRRCPPRRVRAPSRKSATAALPPAGRVLAAAPGPAESLSASDGDPACHRRRLDRRAGELFRHPGG